MKWPDPTSKSKLNKVVPDNHYQKMSGLMHSLTKMETHRDVKSHEILIHQLLAILMKRKDFVADAVFWKELYFRNTWQYPFFHRFHGIPFVNVTKHNHVLSWYMPIFAAQPNLVNIPIVHLDSHDDTNELQGSDKLPILFDKFIKTKDESCVKSAQDIVWDIGSAMSGILYTTGIRPFVWVMPAWLPDIDWEGEYGEHRHGNSMELGIQVHSKAEAKRLENVPWKQYQRPATVASQYMQVHDPASSNENKVKFFKFIEGHTHIVLDIDLDYFCCNGDPDVTKTEEDIASPHRTRYIEFIRQPRNLFDKNSDEYQKQSKLVNKEIQEIDLRLARFRRFLRDLKAAGKKIALLSVSDSTGVDFTECKDCASVTNQYVSSHMALYIRTKVLKAIADVYQSH